MTNQEIRVAEQVIGMIQPLLEIMDMANTIQRGAIDDLSSVAMAGDTKAVKAIVDEHKAEMRDLRERLADYKARLRNES